ncbi:MAG: hypothetical protein ABIK26_02555 [Candidatus Omnitrophota bacterium]
MERKLVSINNVLGTIENLDIDNQAYISEVLSKRLVELRRREIAKRAQVAEQVYKKGEVKRGNIEDLWKDLND